MPCWKSFGDVFASARPKLRAFFACTFLLTAFQSFALPYARIEASFNITNLTTDPFDYAVTDVKVQIQQPNATIVTLPAFFDGGTTWRVRHTPMTNGLFQVLGVTMNGSPLSVSNLQPSSWTVSGKPINAGFVKVDPANANRFITGDRRYFPVGENLAWDEPYPFNTNVVFMVTNILRKLGPVHANWARIWMTRNDQKSLYHARTGVPPPPLGTLLVTNAQVWDNIVEVAEQNDVRFQMVFYPYYYFYSGAQFGFWPQNPYNTANGGFISDAKLFFTNAQAKSLAKRMLRYCIARWGYSTSVMAWELFNEVEFTDAGRAGQTANIGAWHNEMALFLRAQDPYGHLITSSGIDPYYPIWTQLDYYQHHDYPTDLIAGVRDAPGLPTGPTKPIFCGEVGTNAVAHLGLNAPLWAGLMSGQSGGAQPWWWDRHDTNKDYAFFRVIGDFVRLSGIPEQESQTKSAPTVTSAGSALSAYQIGNSGFAALWIWHKNNVFNPSASTSVSGTFSLNGLSSGTYKGVWWDTFAGVALSNFTFTVSGGSPTITTPPILRSVALYVGRPPQAALTAPSFTRTLSNTSPSLILPIVLTNGGGQPFTYSLCVTSASPVTYTVRDSSQSNGPVCAWHDVSGTGTEITTNFTALVAGKNGRDEGISGPYNLGFNFPFYNGMFSNVYISPNGFVTFSPFAGDTSTNLPLPDITTPTNMIAFFWDDIDLSNSVSHVYVAADAMAKTFTVQFQTVRFKDSTSNLTCQLVLKTTGEILMQYLSSGISNTCTVGLQNSDASAGVNVASDQIYLQENFAVRLTPASWVGLPVNAGLVPRTKTETLDVSLDSSGLAFGVHTATLLVSTSDTNQPQFVLPIQLTVQADVYVPESLAAWRSNYFGTFDNEGDAADTADPDADGWLNIVEYALHTDPTIPDDPMVATGVVDDHLIVTFQRTHPAPPDINYSYAVADDFMSGIWQSGPVYTTESVQDNLDGTETVTVMDNLPTSSQPAHYLRLFIGSP